MWSRFLSLLFPITTDEYSVQKSTTLTTNPLTKQSPDGNNILTCSLYTYKDVRSAILIQKKHSNKHASALLATLLSDVLLEDLSDTIVWDTHDIIITTIPLSPRRRRADGHNHLSHILKYISPSLQKMVINNILIQKKDIPMQKMLSRNERLLNVRGAFSVQYSRNLHGKHIIVIDDITTTGATLDEAVRALEVAGATVTPVALARA